MIQQIFKKGDSKKEVISQKIIFNRNNFQLYAGYNNILNRKVLNFYFKQEFDLVLNYMNGNDFVEYFTTDFVNSKLLIMYSKQNNDYLDNFVMNIIPELNKCSSEKEVYNLLLNTIETNN